MGRIFGSKRQKRLRALLFLTVLAFMVVLYLTKQTHNDDKQVKPNGYLPQTIETNNRMVDKPTVYIDRPTVLQRQIISERHIKFHSKSANRKNIFSNITSAIRSSKSPDFFAYFKNRTRLITEYNHEFLVPSTGCNSRTPPFLVILCLSKYDHVASRIAIRQTWGSVSRTNIWPMTNVNFSDVRLLFVLGRSNLNSTEREAFEQEDREHGDIIVSNFIDSYNNLTRKVIVGLKWVEMFCKQAQFVLKVDEDTFIQVANMVSYLKSSKTPKSNTIIGHVYKKPIVLRKGRWGVNKSLYPFKWFPSYVSGNSYVISGNIISKMITAMTYLPYLFIEDVAVTGIARVAVNASLVNDKGFTCFAMPPPKLCDLHNKDTKSATKTSDNFKPKLWEALHWPLSKCKQMAMKKRI